jgi:hypothetical protein
MNLSGVCVKVMCAQISHRKSVSSVQEVLTYLLAPYQQPLKGVVGAVWFGLRVRRDGSRRYKLRSGFAVLLLSVVRRDKSRRYKLRSEFDAWLLSMVRRDESRRYNLHSALSTTHYPLPTIHYPLSTIHYPLFIPRYYLATVWKTHNFWFSNLVGHR